MGLDGPPVSEEPKAELSAYYQVALDSEAFQTLTAACAKEPEFRDLVEALSSRELMARAVTGVQRRVGWTLEDWIVRVTVGYLDALCEGRDHKRGILQEVAWEDFMTGDSRYDPNYVEEECSLNDGKGAGRWVERSGYAASKFHNILVQHYFIAGRVARRQGSDVLRMEFPRRWILMFLSVLAPDLLARMTEQRGGELRAQIENEVEQRVQATLSHQLKRTAGAVRSNLKKIRRKISREQFIQVSEEYERILQETQYQTDLAERTATWSAEPELKIETVPLQPIIEDALVPLRDRFPDVVLQVEISPGLQARGDRWWIREIVFHLAENAFQAVFAGPAGRAAEVIVRGAEEQRAVRIEVLDSGIGVHPEDAERIFQPRVTSKKGGERQPLGTGMGLPIARRHAQRMGGRVGLRLDDAYTCFFLELPGTDTEVVT